MAEETPFALSFGTYGDPRRYMNKGVSPGKKIEAAVAKIKNSPLANLAGIFLADGGSESSGPAAPLGQGVSIPAAPSVGLNVNIPGAIAPGVAPMPEIAPSVMPMQDVDGDGLIDNFWGINK